MKPPMTREALLARLNAAGIDMSPERLAEIEKGTVGPHLLELTGFAEALNTSVHHLLTGSENAAAN